jgi:DNA-binding transcriptional ArsR family regulator
MNQRSVATTVTITRALGHPARLRTLAMLRSGELCVCQITEVLGLAQSTFSTHLRELRRAGLVSERKDGRWLYVALSEASGVAPWIATALGVLGGDPEIAGDARRVEELRRLPVEDLCRLGYEAARARANATTVARHDRHGPGGCE